MAAAALLDGIRLTDAQYADADRRLEWDNFPAKANAMAPVLGVPGERLAGYVAGLVRRAPCVNGCRWENREEIESTIWYRLTQYGYLAYGDWEKVKLTASDGYKSGCKRWYREHSREYVEIDESTMDDVEPFEESIEGKYYLDAIVDILPVLVKDIIQKRLVGVPTTATDRGRLSRFLAVNSDKVREMLATGDPQEWVTPTRGRPKTKA